MIRWPALTLAMTAFAVVLVPGCSNGTHGDGVVITPSMAREVVQGYWPKREAAIAAEDPAQIHSLETGAAGLVDVAIAEDVRSRTPHQSFARERTHQDVMVFVPRQTTYPATFLAEVVTDTYQSHSPYKEIMVFIKSSANTPWLLTLDADSESTQIDPAGDGDGFDPAPPHLPGIEPSKLPGQLAFYWQACWLTGMPPVGTNFLAGYWTTQRCDLIGNSQPGDFNSSCGCIPKLRYTPHPATGQFSFNTHSGSLLTCFAIQINDRSRPPSGHALLQDIGRNHWGGQLPPGAYSQIDQTSLRPACVFTGPPQHDLLEVLSGTDAFTSINGTATTQVQPPQPENSSPGAV